MTIAMRARVGHLGEGREVVTALGAAAIGIGVVWGFLLLIANQDLDTPLTWSDLTAITVMFLGATIVSIGVVVAGLRQGGGSHASGFAFALGLLSLVAGLMFWTGMPLVVGSSAFILGGVARGRMRKVGHVRLALGAQIMGAIATLGTVGIIVAVVVADFAPALPH